MDYSRHCETPPGTLMGATKHLDSGWQLCPGFVRPSKTATSQRKKNKAQEAWMTKPASCIISQVICWLFCKITHRKGNLDDGSRVTLQGLPSLWSDTLTTCLKRTRLWNFTLQLHQSTSYLASFKWRSFLHHPLLTLTPATSLNHSQLHVKQVQLQACFNHQTAAFRKNVKMNKGIVSNTVCINSLWFPFLYGSL